MCTQLNMRFHNQQLILSIGGMLKKQQQRFRYTDQLNV